MSAGYLQFTQLTYQVKENGEWLTNKPSVERIGGVDGAVSVRVAFSSNKNNKAGKDIDFIVPAQLLSWNDGESGNKEINLSMLQHNIKEDDEVFNLSLSKITIASYGERKKANVIISDDDLLIIPSSKSNIKLSRILPDVNPVNEGHIWISTLPLPEQKEFVYLGINQNNTLSWKKLSDSAIVSPNNPYGNPDFKGRLWINTNTNNVWIGNGINWIPLTDGNNAIDLSPINNQINALQSQLILTNNIANVANVKAERLDPQIDMELIYEQGMTYNPGIATMIDWKHIQSSLINYDTNTNKLLFQKTGIYELEMNLSYNAGGVGKLGFRVLNNNNDTCGRSHIIRTIQGDNQSYVKFLLAIPENLMDISLQG